MNNSEGINTTVLKEYVDVAQIFYTLINVNIQQYDGLQGICSGLPTIDVQEHYIKNPKKNDPFRTLMLDRFNYLENSVGKIYSIIEKNNLLKEDKDAENSVSKILLIINIMPLLKKIYFGQTETPKTTNKKYGKIDLIDEIISLDKESDKLQDIFAGLNIYLNN